MSEYPLVLVEWRDAVSTDEWADIDALDGSLANILTAGFMIKDTKHAIVIACTLDTDNASACMSIAIPKKWISKITPLGEISRAPNEKMN